MRRSAFKARVKWRAGEGGGFTIVEILYTTGIMGIALVGILQLFVYCLWSSESAGMLTDAVGEACSRCEEIRGLNFDAILAAYGQGGTPGPRFTPTRLQGVGLITIDTGNPDLIEARVVVCWQDRGGSVVGEDQNLNGYLDAGEDVNGNGLMDSPAVAVTLAARK